MPATRFETNDRVRLLRATRSLPAGLVGTIEQVYLLECEGIYEILFDGEFQRRLIHSCDLERVNGASAAERERTAGVG